MTEAPLHAFEVRLCRGGASRLEAVFDDEDLAQEAARRIAARNLSGDVVVAPGAALCEMPGPWVLAEGARHARPHITAGAALRGSLFMVALVAVSGILLL